MSKTISNRSFFVGFIFGVVLIAVITTFIYFKSHCHHCVRVFGFPFIFWEQFAGNIEYNPETGFSFPNDFENFYVWALISDILFSLIFSIGLGFIFRFIWSKIATRKFN